jgi:hypothetical protein
VIYHVSAKRNKRTQPERARTKKAPPQLAAADREREQKKTRHWGESGGIFTESSQKIRSRLLNTPIESSGLLIVGEKRQ